MKHVLVGMALLLASGTAGQHALGDQPDSQLKSSDEVDSIEQSRPSTRPGCDRIQSRAIAESEVSVQRLMGMRVTNPLGEEIGRVSDLVLDRCGRVTEMVVHVGGFMGLGGEHVPIALDKVRIKSSGRSTALVALVRETRKHMLSDR